MDSLTHLTAGALAPLAFRKAPRLYALVLFGILAGQAPDIDILAGTGAHAMLALHRGVTHSAALMLPVALLLAMLFKLFLARLISKEVTVRVESGIAVINRSDDWPLPQIFMAALLGLWLHVYLDCMTTFGTLALWPFSARRVALPAMFIVDLGFTVPLTLILLYCLVGLKKASRLDQQVKWARRGLIWILCYPLACLALNAGLSYKYNHDYAEAGAAVEKIRLVPVLGSPVYWKAVGENEREYRLAWVETYRPFSDPDFHPAVYPKVPPEDWLALQKALPIFKDYAAFAHFPTVEETAGDGYVERTYRDLLYIYSLPNFILEKLNYRDGLFNMQTRESLNGQIYAWRYLQNGSGNAAMWTAVRQPADPAEPAGQAEPVEPAEPNIE